MKRTLLLILVTVALIGSLVSTACCPTEVKQPIKIGVLLDASQAFETEALHGIELALAAVNYTVAGRQIELIVEDYAGDPGLCLTKVQKLNEMDNVDLVIGPHLSSATLAIRSYIHDNKLLTISHMTSTSTMIEEDYFTKYFFRSSYNGGYQVTPVAAYIAYEVKGYRNATCIAMDYAAGHTELEGFKEVFEALGGTVIQEIYTPMNTADYGPYMAMIDVENADFVWAFHWGGDAIRLVTSLDDYGIKDKLSMFFSAAPVEFSWLAPQGDSALGIEDASHYSTALNTTENTIFAQAIWGSYQEPATLYTEHGYVAAQMAILALQAVDGDVEDVDSLIEAIENLEFEAPRGPIKFELHTPVQNVYHRVVERVDGELQNTVIDTYPDIGPYWLPEELR
jgi:branched-chain amino acid transport system substrate-binding protein